MWKKILLGVAVLAVAGGAVAYVKTRPEPPDTRFTGAYALADGTQVFLGPRDGKVLRYRMTNGTSGVLWPTGDGEYEGGPGWDQREPVVNRVKLAQADGHSGFDWRRADDPVVHGSESYSAVDYYTEPYMYAANGFATLAFDKRGTGESEGKYLQNFHVLSDDVVAAVRWLRTQPEIDGNRIHLAGFSQGGWIAPLAALKDGNIASVLVGYGVMVPVTGEDRWGYFYALQQKGFGAGALAAADRVNAVIGDIIDRHENRWSDFADLLHASRRQPWFEGVRGSDSILGQVADSRMPLSMWRLYV